MLDQASKLVSFSYSHRLENDPLYRSVVFNRRIMISTGRIRLSAV